MKTLAFSIFIVLPSLENSNTEFAPELAQHFIPSLPVAGP